MGNPVQRFTEDALRILRGIRFASVLNFKVEEKTGMAMLKCRHLLKNVSQERITVEFCKTLLGVNVYAALLEFKDVLSYILPEIRELIGFKQHNRHHVYDVYEHSLKAVAAIDGDIVLRTAMFFHDIAKPACYSLDEKKVGHFYGHSEISAQMTEKILQKMRFPTAGIRIITELIRFHNIQIGLNSKDVKKLLNKLGEVQFKRLLKVKRADAMAKNPSFAGGKLKKLDLIEQILNDILTANTCVSLRDLAVDGNDLIQLGIPEGEQIGIVLNRLLEMVLNEEVENNKDALLEKVKPIIAAKTL